MLHLRLITLFAILLIKPVVSHAGTLENDFQRCASAALQEREQSAAVIKVNNDSRSPSVFDHDASRIKSEYRMLLTNNVSGEELGAVTCKLDYSGNIIAAVFDR